MKRHKSNNHVALNTCLQAVEQFGSNSPSKELHKLS